MREVGILQLVLTDVGRVVRRHGRLDPDDDAGAVGIALSGEAELIPVLLAIEDLAGDHVPGREAVVRRVIEEALTPSEISAPKSMRQRRIASPRSAKHGPGSAPQSSSTM